MDKFVCRGKDYAPTTNSVICSFHIEEKYLIKGEKRIRLNRSSTGHLPKRLYSTILDLHEQRDEYNDFVQRDKTGWMKVVLHLVLNLKDLMITLFISESNSTKILFQELKNRLF